MNKQQVIEKIKQLSLVNYSSMEFVEEIVNIISQIDEPQKVVVPKFVAEWIEKCKDMNCSLRDAMKNTKLSAELNVWFLKSGQDIFTYPNQEIFARAWLDGFEIEQEQLYTVEIPNPNRSGKGCAKFRLEKIGNKAVLVKRKSKECYQNKPNQKLTESEIKKDFDWAWQFAKEVE